MPEIPKIIKNCDTEGILSTTAGIMGSLQANEVLKTILNLKILSKKILIFDGLNMQLRKVNLIRNSKCINKC